MLKNAFPSTQGHSQRTLILARVKRKGQKRKNYS
jgi:hypothetical protein